MGCLCTKSQQSVEEKAVGIRIADVRINVPHPQPPQNNENYISEKIHSNSECMLSILKSQNHKKKAIFISHPRLKIKYGFIQEEGIHGSTYTKSTGLFLDGQLHQYGKILKYSNDKNRLKSYDGSFKDGQPLGFGTCVQHLGRGNGIGVNVNNAMDSVVSIINNNKSASFNYMNSIYLSDLDSHALLVKDENADEGMKGFEWIYHGFWYNFQKQGRGIERRQNMEFRGTFKDNEPDGIGDLVQMFYNSQLIVERGSFGRKLCKAGPFIRKTYVVQPKKNEDQIIPTPIMTEYFYYNPDSQQARNDKPKLTEKHNELFSPEDFIMNNTPIDKKGIPEFKAKFTQVQNANVYGSFFTKFCPSYKCKLNYIDGCQIRYILNLDGSPEESFYGKGNIINYPEHFILKDFEKVVYGMINKLGDSPREPKPPPILECIAKNISYNTFSINVLEPSEGEEFLGNINDLQPSCQVLQMLIAEKFNDEFNLDYRLKGRALVPEYAKVCSRELINSLKKLESYNIYHGKLRPKYIFTLSTNLFSIQIKFVGFSNAKIFFPSTNSCLNRYEWLFANNRINHMEGPPLEEFKKDQVLDYDLAFFPFDYDIEEEYYLPPQYQSSNSHRPYSEIVKCNVVKLEIFAVAVIIMELFISTLEKGKGDRLMKILQASCISEEIERLQCAYSHRYVKLCQLIKDEIPNFEIFEILKKMLQEEFENFSSIPDMFNNCKVQISNFQRNQSSSYSEPVIQTPHQKSSEIFNQNDFAPEFSPSNGHIHLEEERKKEETPPNQGTYAPIRSTVMFNSPRDPPQSIEELSKKKSFYIPFMRENTVFLSQFVRRLVDINRDEAQIFEQGIHEIFDSENEDNLDSD